MVKIGFHDFFQEKVCLMFDVVGLICGKNVKWWDIIKNEKRSKIMSGIIIKVKPTVTAKPRVSDIKKSRSALPSARGFAYQHFYAVFCMVTEPFEEIHIEGREDVDIIHDKKISSRQLKHNPGSNIDSISKTSGIYKCITDHRDVDNIHYICAKPATLDKMFGDLDYLVKYLAVMELDDVAIAVDTPKEKIYKLYDEHKPHIKYDRAYLSRYKISRTVQYQDLIVGISSGISRLIGTNNEYVVNYAFLSLLKTTYDSIFEGKGVITAAQCRHVLDDKSVATGEDIVALLNNLLDKKDTVVVQNCVLHMMRNTDLLFDKAMINLSLIHI